jgi:peptidoglycan hydrolase CwlO-like protein
VSTKIFKNTEVDRGLENKIEKLVDKIEELIEKLDEGHSQSTESQQ